MIFLRTGDWVLVADGEKALLLENAGDTEKPNLRLIDKDEQDNPPDREQATDRPGRFRDGGPGQKSAVDETDFHAQAKEEFAADLADDLNRRAEAGAFSRIVLVASSEVLGAIRPRLSPRAEEAVVAEIPKVLTNHPLDKLGPMLVKDLAA